MLNGMLTRKLSYRKYDRAMRRIYECPENVRDSLTMPAGRGYTFPKKFNGLFFPIYAMNMRAKFAVHRNLLLG